MTRMLMERREGLRSRQEGRRPRALTEWDFLLGVHDETRLGALRFRRAFVSAMTLTQRSDGEAGASYLELVDLLQSRGAATWADCRQLFRRVVFNILIHNTDDDLRNHGFLIDSEGIRLSPAYDLNPSIERQDLSLAINEVETACDVAIAIEACEGYGLARREAEVILKEVKSAVGEWRGQAAALGIPRSEQALMAAAFETPS